MVQKQERRRVHGTVRRRRRRGTRYSNRRERDSIRKLAEWRDDMRNRETERERLDTG